MDTWTLSPGVSSSGNKVEMFEYAVGFSPVKEVEDKVAPRPNHITTTTTTNNGNGNGNNNGKNNVKKDGRPVAGKTVKRRGASLVHVSIGNRATTVNHSLPEQVHATMIPTPNDHDRPTPAGSLGFATISHERTNANDIGPAAGDANCGDTNGSGNPIHGATMYASTPQKENRIIVFDYTYDDEEDDDDAPMPAPFPKTPTPTKVPDPENPNDDAAADDDDDDDDDDEDGEVAVEVAVGDEDDEEVAEEDARVVEVNVDSDVDDDDDDDDEYVDDNDDADNNDPNDDKDDDHENDDNAQSKENSETNPDDTTEASGAIDNEPQNQQSNGWTDRDAEALKRHLKNLRLRQYPKKGYDWTKLYQHFPHQTKNQVVQRVSLFFRRQKKSNEPASQKIMVASNSEADQDDSIEARSANESESPRTGNSHQSRLWTDEDAEALKQHLESHNIYQYPRGFDWSPLVPHFPRHTKAQIAKKAYNFFRRQKESGNHDYEPFPKKSPNVKAIATEESEPDALSTEPTSEGEARIPSTRQRKRARRYSDCSESPPPPPPRKRSSTARNDQSTTTTTPSSPSTTQCLPVSSKKTTEVPSDDAEPYVLTPDPNQYYIEEESYLYHNPPLPSTQTQGVLPKDLKPIPPPPPPPSPSSIPNTGKCTWTFDEKNRIFMADFSNSNHAHVSTSIDPEDEKFMLQIMERDDVTVISQGLLDTKSIDPSLWTIQNIGASLNQDFFHRFRRFDTKILNDGTEKIFEVDVPYSMKIIDYCRYLDQRAKCLKNTPSMQRQQDKGKDKDREFVFTNHKGIEHRIDVTVSALYLIDMDIKKLLPELHDDFRSAFRFPSALPGGALCMMNKVTPDARPFMGPNLYITPPASFTHFHQDGHGTVDSGHLVITGYNEVVLLRRLTERHKRHALWLLTGLKEDANKATQTFLDGLYSEPHSDGLGEKPNWPSKDRIEQCREMGYCPTIIMLKPGQFIHIGKGRLHAFRKMSNRSLPKNDCHYELREEVLSQNNFDTEQLCVSIAWDWMFRGHTPRGIYREVVATLEAAILTRKRGRLSLAIPELALLRMAQSFAKPSTSFTNLKGLIGMGVDPLSSTDKQTDRVTVCRGILPGLRYVINEHLAAIDNAMNDVNISNQTRGRVSLAERPNSHENPELCTVDPHGNNDFSCKLCRKELSNVYYHCDGCEKLLNRDFNLCVSCHSNKYYERFVQVHPNNTTRHATINHVGDMKYDRASRCPCKRGPCCKDCSYCLGCSCRCHTQFTLNFRLFDKETEKGILQRVDAVANSGNEKLDEMEERYLTDQAFTSRRLDDAKIAWGHSDEYI